MVSVSKPLERDERRWRWSRLYGLALVVYVFALWFTDANFMGDTIWYAENIQEGRTLWDAGHLLWRPIGAFAADLGLRVSEAAQIDRHTTVVASLIALNLVAGLVAVASLLGWLRRFCADDRIVGGVTIAFIFSQGFLNYTQTGSSYGAGLALLLLGLYLLGWASTTDGRTGWAALLAGASYAAAMCVWLPYVVAVPAALASPILLFGRDRRRFQLALLAAVSCAALTLGAYIGVAWYLGITSVGEFQRWILASSRGSTTGGWFRMALGFARSFVNIERDGLVFKRFLLNDPYNPVSLWDLLRLSTYKLALFYLCLGALALTLLRSAGGRWVAGLVALTAGPALALAVIWQGGDMERYLALYPALLGGFAYALARRPINRPLIALASIFLLVEIATNASALATSTLSRVQTRAAERIEPVVQTFKPHSLVVTLNQQDEVWYFNHSFPLHPLNRSHTEFTYSLSGRADWQQKLAKQIAPVWAAGGEVWISQRLLAERPEAHWAWVESDTQDVQWHELREFFMQFEQQRTVGGVDGFALITMSSRNKRALGLEPQAVPTAEATLASTTLMPTAH